MLRVLCLVLCLVLSVVALPAMAEIRVRESASEIATGFVPVVREAAPAVVDIYASRVAEVPGLARPEGLVISQVHPDSVFGGYLACGDVVAAVNSPAEMVYRLSLRLRL